MPDSNLFPSDYTPRDPVLVQECLNLMADVYRSPTFCISYYKQKILKNEFFSLKDRLKCYDRVRSLRDAKGITCLSVEFYFDLEVEKI